MLPIEITFSGHAAILLEVDNLKIIIDPHVNKTYRSNLFGYYPEREIEISHISDVDVIFISHSHRDHFDVKSLIHFNKNATIFFPNDTRINFALTQLGFQNIFSVNDWTSLSITENLKITWTPSTFRVPEHGFLIEYSGITIWNMVDSHVTKEWCNQVLILTDKKCIDFVLFPCQPLIEANITHSLTPLVKREDIEEIKMVIDTIKPTYTIPFADGHYCLNEASWINKHWIPFSELDKLEAIDASEFKTQILDIETGEKISISKSNYLINFNIIKTDYIKSFPKQTDRFFEPSGFMPPICASFIDTEENNAFKYLNDLITNFKFNLHTRFPFLLDKITPGNCNYTIKLIDNKFETSNYKLFSLFDGEFYSTHKDSNNRIEIVISESDFIKVYESKLSFSALLIGGRIREFHFLFDENINESIFRDFSDILGNNKKPIISGIFIFNQLLTINSNRIFNEISVELNNQAYKSVSSLIQAPPNLISSSNGSISLVNKLFLSYVEDYLQSNLTLDGISKEVTFNNELFFIGFFGDRKWIKSKAKKGIVIPINLLYSQSIFGTGVKFPINQFNELVNNINSSGILDWCVDASLLSFFDIPDWRIFNLLPFSANDLKKQLDRKGFVGHISENKFPIEEFKWWLGIPEIENLNDAKNITVQLSNSTFVRGALNQLQISNLIFKSQQAFRVKIGKGISNEFQIVSSLLHGNIRFSWLFDEHKLDAILNLSKLNSLDELIPKIVLPILVQELKH